MPDFMGDGDIAFPNLGIYLKNVPQSFTVFGFEIALYGMIIGIGMICAFLVVAAVAKKLGMNPDDFFDLGMYLVIFGVIGARLYYVIFSWDHYKDNPLSIFNIREGGLAIYGGIILGFITHIIYCKIKKANMYKMGDVGFLGVIVGQIFGRWGNFTNREVFGTYTNNLLAMRLPVSAVRSRDIDAAISQHMSDATNYIQVHPTFLYESLYNLCLFGLMLLFQTKKKFDGEVILLYMGGYGIGRFVIEGIRTDQLKIGNTGIAVSQMIGLLLFIAALLIDLVVRVKIEKDKIISEEKEKENEKETTN